MSRSTSRDRVQQLVDLGRKIWRRWWLVAVFAVAGGGLSLGFAVNRPRSYVSSATVFYQERIESQLLSPGRDDVAQRNIGDRYRELLLADGQLEQIIRDPGLDPFPDEPGPARKIDQLRRAVRFVAHGAMVFRIEYSDSDPDRAMRIVARLTRLLQETDDSLRIQQSTRTVEFLTREKDAAATELARRETALHAFLAQHAEFTQDPGEAAFGAPPKDTGRALSAKERRLRQIQAQLDAPGAAAPMSPTSVTLDAQRSHAAVDGALGELQAAQGEIDDARRKGFTDRHPSMSRAQDRLAAAQQRLRAAQAAVQAVESLADGTALPLPAPDRARLEDERRQLEREIRDEQLRLRPATASDRSGRRVVELADQNANLRRDVSEQRERVRWLADRVFHATIDANLKLAEQGGRLSVVNPASRPVQPTGAGQRVVLMAGLALFLTLGLSIAVGLAMIDDRLYRRGDLEELEIAVLAVIPPIASHRRGATAPQRGSAGRHQPP